MGVSTFTQPNFNTQTGEQYKTAIDDSFNVHNRLAGSFAPHQQDTADMTVAVDAGYILSAGTLSDIAAQSTATITAPTSDPRIDRVVVDKATGAVSVIGGSEAASPSAPAVPSDKLFVCQVALTVGQTEIVNADITDERVASSSVSIDDISDINTHSTASNLQSSDRFIIWDNGSSQNNAVTWGTVLNEIASDSTSFNVSNFSSSAIVTESEGIDSSDNDTSLPTSAAVKDYVQNNGVDQQQVAQAWVNFDGTGTVSIRDSFNVSSITDNGNGDYTVNLTSAMASTDYVVQATASWDGTISSRPGWIGLSDSAANYTTSSFKVLSQIPNNFFPLDAKYAMITVFGDV